ncbi:MAG: B12-binding domain-containing radical SAM protein [Candidatus Hodarchaeota archaeon]
MSQIIDVLLVNPGTELKQRGSWNREPPLGLLYLTSILEKKDYLCQLLDLSIDEREIEEILEGIPPARIVAFTALTNMIGRTLELTKRVKNWYKARSMADPVEIIGGAHATFVYEEILKGSSIDFCILGEAESGITSFVEITLSSPKLELIKARFQEQANPGLELAFLDNNGNLVVKKSNRGPLDELDRIPFPARHVYPLNRPNHVYDTATIIVNRGCPNNCIFCSRQALFKKARWRSPENVLKELEEIHAMGIYNYYNIYDNLTISKAFMDELLEKMIENENLHLPWGAELRVDMLDEESVKKLVDANCQLVATGVESANPEILKMAGKFQPVEKVAAGLALLKRAGIPVQAYFVIGLPGETRETFEETLEFIKKSPLEPGIDKIDFFAATPYPGSRLHVQRNELGLQIIDSNYENWDCQHLICVPPSITRVDLESIWKQAKEHEIAFNAKRI